jgi:hypothetical protein
MTVFYSYVIGCTVWPCHNVVHYNIRTDSDCTRHNIHCSSRFQRLLIKYHCILVFYFIYSGCMRYCGWLRHRAASWKVAGSIPDEDTGFFNWPNSSSRTVALGLTQPLTEISTRHLPWDKGQPARKADNLTAICLLSGKCGSLDVSQPCGPPRPVTGIALPF